MVDKKKDIAEEADSSNLYLKSDRRFGRIGAKIARFSRRNLKKHQQKQQSEIEEKLEGDDSVEINSVIREPNGTGGENLARLLDVELGMPRIVLLANGIVNPQDIIQVSPFLEKYGMRVFRLVTKTRSSIIDTFNGVINSDTATGYTINTVKVIQMQLFWGRKCKFIMVRNASAQDLQEAVQYGGNNTAVIVIGHGSLGSVSMTDGKVENTDIRTPQEPLKAFIQHTCASDKGEREMMGERLAEKVYGWKRDTNPTDFIDDPLHLRK